MPGRSEKERRKQMLHDLKANANQEFENNLPMSRDNFKKLFDYLDIQLADKECDDTSSLTISFLDRISTTNKEEILEWLADKGGHCDCEILANVEEQFE
jgi:Protein of unknown function (DUF2695)